VLIVTAIDQDDRLASAQDAGADDYLTTPFSFVVPLSCVRSCGVAHPNIRQFSLVTTRSIPRPASSAAPVSRSG